MRSAIALVWFSLFWTLLCFLFYRDRTLIVQASLPVWVASAAAWILYRLAASLPMPWRRAPKPRARKTAKPKPASRTRSARPTARASTAKPRKRRP